MLTECNAFDNILAIQERADFSQNIMQDQNKRDASVIALVIEALPNTLFKIRREDNTEEMLAYLSGKMRLNRIRVLIGDKVIVELDQYGGKGRIVKRV